MTIDPLVVQAKDVLKYLKLRLNGVLVPYNDTDQTFDLTVLGGEGGTTETPFTPAVDGVADLILAWSAGGTNGHAPTLGFVVGPNNTYLGINGSGELAWRTVATQADFALALGTELERIADVTSGGTAGHNPTLEITPLGSIGQAIGVKSNGQLGWITPPGSTTVNVYSVLAGGNGGSSLLAGNTVYMAPGVGGLSSTEARLGIPMPMPGTVDMLYASTNAAPGTSQSITATARLNGANTVLTTVISNSATAANDQSHNFDVVAGDLVTVEFVSSGGAATSYPNFSMRFKAAA